MKKKAIIFGAIGLLVLAGGAGGGLYFTGMLDSMLGNEVEAAAEGNGDGELEEHGAASAESIYIQLDPMSAPVFENNRVRHNIFLVLSLEVADNSLRRDVSAAMPRLRDAMIRDLYGTPVVSDESGALDIEGLRSRMLSIAQRVVGTDVVLDLFIVKATKTG